MAGPGKDNNTNRQVFSLNSWLCLFNSAKKLYDLAFLNFHSKPLAIALPSFSKKTNYSFLIL